MPLIYTSVVFHKWILTVETEQNTKITFVDCVTNMLDMLLERS